MELIHRKIDILRDREYVLECHCRINYECDTPWAREMPYEKYRSDWFSCSSQLEAFLSALAESSHDERTIADIVETEAGERVGYLWAPFTEDKDSGFRMAEVQDIFVETRFRGNGVAADLYEYVEASVRKSGAKVLRAGTGCENSASLALHKKRGFYTYRVEFEKLL